MCWTHIPPSDMYALKWTNFNTMILIAKAVSQHY